MIGKIPNVLKMKMHINHAKWLFRAAFHIAINFQTVSQIAAIIITGMSHGSIE
jgi:hypothetical protein